MSRSFLDSKLVVKDTLPSDDTDNLATLDAKGEIKRTSFNLTEIGSTDLSYSPSPIDGTVESSTGNDAIIPLANATNAGLQRGGFYEEGSFTPVIVDIGGGATYSQPAGAVVGNFVRVGNDVTISIYSQNIGTVGTPTGRLLIQGLPFSVASQNIHSFAISRFKGSSLTDDEVRSLGAYSSVAYGGKTIIFNDKITATLTEDVVLTDSDIFISGSYTTVGNSPY